MAGQALAVNNTPVALVNARMKKMIEALPSNNKMAIKRFQAAAIGVAMSPAIADCTPESVFSCVYTAARLNLIPDPALKLIHIVPFKERGIKKAQIIIGYGGYVELARRAAPSLIVRTGSVYANDEYELIDGMDLEFRITKRAWELGKPNGPFLFSYCVSGLSGQEKVVKICSRQDGERIAASKSDYTPWKKGGPLKDTGVPVDFPAMCEKTAVRASAKLWSLDPEKDETKKFMEALAADEDDGQGEVGDLGAYGLDGMGEGDDPGAPPPAPDAGNVQAGRVNASIKRKPTPEEKNRLITLVGDRMMELNIEPTEENANKVMAALTGGIMLRDATIDQLMTWAAALPTFDVAAALRG